MHDGYKVGRFWRNIPNYEQRGICPVCEDEYESLEHILIECQAPERELVWDLAKELFSKKGLRWPELRFGTILGCGHSNFKDSEGRRRTGANRLYKILISESAHFIWALRCERRITKEDDAPAYSEDEV